MANGMQRCCTRAGRGSTGSGGARHMADDIAGKRNITIGIGFEGSGRGPESLGDAATLAEELGLTEADRLSNRVLEMVGLLWMPKDLSQTEVHARLVRTVELYESLAPADGAEGMLAMQMVGTHHAALECLRRSALPAQTFEGRDMALKRHQAHGALQDAVQGAAEGEGQGPQKVTVEHVHVAAGGQAIVGNVHAGGAKSTETPPEVLEKDRALPGIETPLKRKVGR